jgi:phage shock protein C
MRRHRRTMNCRKPWRRDFDWNCLHLRRAPRRSPNARILGVCAGLAEYFDLSTKGVRIGAVILLIFTGFWPLVGIYLLAALLMRPAHAIPPLPGEDAEYEYRREYRKEKARMAREKARDQGRARARAESEVREEAQTEEDYADSSSFAQERRAATERLKQTFDKMNKKLQNLEDSVTAKEFDWERRYDQS